MFGSPSRVFLSPFQIPPRLLESHGTERVMPSRHGAVTMLTGGIYGKYRRYRRGILVGVTAVSIRAAIIERLEILRLFRHLFGLLAALPFSVEAYTNIAICLAILGVILTVVEFIIPLSMNRITSKRSKWEKRGERCKRKRRGLAMGSMIADAKRSWSMAYVRDACPRGASPCQFSSTGRALLDVKYRVGIRATPASNKTSLQM